MQEVEIKKATRKDVPLLLDLVTEFFIYVAEMRGSHADLVKDYKKVLLTYYLKNMINGKLTIYYALINKKPVGLAVCEITTDSIPIYKNSTAGKIRHLFVSKQHRHHGIGGQLIKAALIHFKKKHISHIILLANNKNKNAIRLYEHLDFKPKYTQYETNI